MAFDNLTKFPRIIGTMCSSDENSDSEASERIIDSMNIQGQ